MTFALQRGAEGSGMWKDAMRLERWAVVISLLLLITFAELGWG